MGKGKCDGMRWVVSAWILRSECTAQLRQGGHGAESVWPGRRGPVKAEGAAPQVTRDRIMVDFHRQYPQYDFATHKGYGTPTHMKLIHQHGPCPIHRRSFQPTKGLLAAAAERLGSCAVAAPEAAATGRKRSLKS